MLQSLLQKKIIMPGDTYHKHKPCMSSLIYEMAKYAQACSSENYSKLVTMEEKSNRVEHFYMNLPDSSTNSWFKLYKVVALVQVHSCSCERAFSKLRLALKNKQVLRDAVEASLMLRFNKSRDIAKGCHDSDVDDDNESVHCDDEEEEKYGLSDNESNNEGSDYGDDIGNYDDRNKYDYMDDVDCNKESSFESAHDPLLGDIINSIEKLKLPVTNKIVSVEKTGITVNLFGDIPDTGEKNKLIRCSFCQKICTTTFDKSTHEGFCMSAPGRTTAEKGINFHIGSYMRYVHIYIYVHR
jgi:hypothetical protein